MINKNLWLIIGLIIVAVVLFLVTNEPKNMESLFGNNGVKDNINNETEEIEGIEDTSFGSINDGVTSPTISYKNALSEYKNARLVFDGSCKVTPNNISIKNGMTLMIDNRAPVDRVVKVGNPLNIKAYGFKLINVSSETLPAVLSVDCDQSPNMATVTVEQ